MKSKWYILILVTMLIITAFNYKDNYNLSTPSIKVSKVILENNNVLCLQIIIVSVDYIDSLIVEPNNLTNNLNKRVFVFDSKTKRAIVNYYYYEENLEKALKFSLNLKNNSSKNKYETIFNLKDI